MPERIFLVLPVFNEEEGLGALLPAVAALGPVNIVAVDDGSRDGSDRLLRGFRHPNLSIEIVTHAENQGLGATIRDGLTRAAERASPDHVIVTMDADNTHPVELIPSMVALIREGADLVVASRYQPGSAVVGLQTHRRLLSNTCSLLFRLVVPIPNLRDYTCGFRAYRASLLQDAFRRGTNLVAETGFAAMTEILLKLKAFAPRIAEVPLVLRYDRKPTPSKMRVLRTVMNLLRLMASSRHWPRAAAPPR